MSLTRRSSRRRKRSRNVKRACELLKVSRTAYYAREFADLAADCDVAGQRWDNALAESFLSSLKGELINTRPWPTRARARRAIIEYIT